jgi:hypothetical protein
MNILIAIIFMSTAIIILTEVALKLYFSKGMVIDIISQNRFHIVTFVISIVVFFSIALNN